MIGAHRTGSVLAGRPEKAVYVYGRYLGKPGLEGAPDARPRPDCCGPNLHFLGASGRDLLLSVYPFCQGRRIVEDIEFAEDLRQLVIREEGEAVYSAKLAPSPAPKPGVKHGCHKLSAFVKCEERSPEPGRVVESCFCPKGVCNYATKRYTSVGGGVPPRMP